MNMQGAGQTDAFVGPDFIGMGEQIANMMVAKCGEGTDTSHKISIVQGPLTGGVSFFQVQGINKVLAQHPEIQVVSSQAADWDASKARAITETVLQQHPDLCGVIDTWDGQGVGTAAAIGQAGDLMGFGGLFGIPSSFVVLIVVAAIGHILLTRSRPGWRAMAIGGSRRSAHNIGLPVRSTICAAYTISGMLCGLAGVLYAARLGGAGTDTGMGLEISALTAAVLGGNSLGGGRGSIVKALIGAVIVLVMTNGVLRLGLNSGSGPMVLGLTLLFAVFVDVRWLKNRDKLLSKVYVSPTYVELPEPRPTEAGSGALALNNRLGDVEIIGLGDVESPEDVILDDEDYLYCGTRHGDIVRFSPPNYQHSEVYAHIGGSPLGMSIDKEGSLLVCVGGMGLYKVARDRNVSRVTDETNRSPLSVVDDSRLRLADDLDIAPDGRVYFSEATIRYEMHGLAGRRAGEPRQRPHRLLQPGHGKNPHGFAQPDLSQRCLPRAGRPVDPVCRELGLPHQPLLDLGPEGGQGRTRGRQAAGLSR